MNKKIFSTIIIVIVLVFGIIALSFYKKIYSSNIPKTTILYINSDSTFEELQQKITPYLKNIESFNWVSKKKNFTIPEGGKYVLRKGMSNNTLVNMFRIGRQTPVKVTFNNQDTLEKFVERIAEQIEVDSLALITSFTNSNFLKENEFTEKSVLQIFIPNTYEFYWTTSANAFRKRMLKNYHRFWNTHRMEKAKNLSLTKNEVIILASIVQKETAKKEERPIVAGLYLNRLQKGWALQADPTIIYLLKEKRGQDFIVKRVLNKDLEIVSPYNTYLNAGLPPALISMPDQSSIDAVLNAEKHSYYYMCANIEKIGYHKFAKTLRQHNRNAAKYQHWLNKLGVNR